MKNSLVEISLPLGASPEPVVDAEERLPKFVRGPKDAAKRLRGVKVLVVGAGSIGFEFIQQLARWLVALLVIVDPKRFKGASLITHSVPPEAIGAAKAVYAGQLAKRISPHSRVFVLEGLFVEIPLSLLAEFDVVFLATDNLVVELEVSQACLALGIPVIQASVHGETLSGHVRFYGHDGASAPCVACGFTSQEWTHLNASTQFSCEGHTSPAPQGGSEGQPTMSVHALCSLMAQLALLEFLKDLLGLAQSARNQTLEYCAYLQKILMAKLTRHPQCPCSHVAFRRAAPPRFLAECSLRDLMETASGNAAGDRNVSFEADEYHFVEQAICSCGEDQQVRRFVNSDASNIGPCARCQRPLAPHPFHSFRTVPASALSQWLDRPLRELGADGARWVIVRRDDDAVLFLQPSSTTSLST